MLSESARMASAAEARFRIDAPNSKPRAVKVIALDRPSEAAIKQLSGPQWSNATFLTASSFAGTPGKEAFSVSGWLSDLAGRTTNLIDEVSSADLVVMVATAGTGRPGGVDHRRGLRRKARDDDGARARCHGEQRRGAVADAGDVAAACADAGDLRQRRLHRGHAHGAAGVKRVPRTTLALDPSS